MKHLLRFSAFQATLYQLREVIMKAILTQSSALTTRYLKIGGDLMKARPIRNRPVNTHGISMKKLTALSLFTLLVTLLALGGAPRAWGQAACTGCTTSQDGDRAVYISSETADLHSDDKTSRLKSSWSVVAAAVAERY